MLQGLFPLSNNWHLKSLGLIRLEEARVFHLYKAKRINKDKYEVPRIFCNIFFSFDKRLF